MKFPIPQDWDNVSWCRWSVCWPNSEGWEAFLRGLLTLPQRGWTWDERTGNILSVQEIGRQITSGNIPLDGVIMSCNDTNLADSFNNIALAIRSLAVGASGNGCCTTVEVIVNNTFQGSVIQPVGGNSTPVYGSQPGLVLGPGEFPDSFPSLEAYNQEKCRNAHLLTDSLIVSLNNLAGFTFMESVALVGFIGAAIVASIIFPPTIIPLMIGVLIVLAVEVTLLSAAAAYIEDHKSEVICMLYDSEGTELFLSVFADFLDAMVAFLSVSSPVGVAIKTVCLLLFNTDTINRLFSGAASAGYPDADCSDCGCELFRLDLSVESGGYALSSLDCGEGTPSTSGASVSWSGSGLAISAPNTGSTNAANAQGDPVEVVANVGDIARLTGRRTVDNNNFVRVDMVTTESGCVNIGSGGFVATDPTFIEMSLDAIAGETIEQINIYVNNSISQEFGVIVGEIYIGCP